MLAGAPVVEVMTASAPPSGGETTTWDSLVPALEWLDALLERATLRSREVYAEWPAGDQFRGLYVSEEDVDSLLARKAGEPLLFTEGPDQPLGAPRLEYLRHVFGLSVFDTAVVLLALAPELDRRYERLYAYLQDNVNLRRPTVDLALQLFCSSASQRLGERSRFTENAPLVDHGVVRLIAENEHGTLLASTIKLDEQVIAFLLAESPPPPLDGRLADVCRVVAASPGSCPGFPDESLRRLTTMCSLPADPAEPLCLQFPADGRDAAALLSSALAREVLEFDATAPDAPRLLPLLAMSARLRGAIPCLRSAGPPPERAAVEHLGRFVRRWQGFCAVVGPLPALGFDVRTVDVTAAGFVERRACWTGELAAHELAVEPADIDDLAGMLRLAPSEIREAVGRAAWRAQWRAGGAPGWHVDPADLYESACELSTTELATLARRLRPSAAWDDLILPPDGVAQLRELCARVARHRHVIESWGFGKRLSLGRGTIALFAGPPGTGKTLAANIVAAELRLDLCKIDLSSVVSKYIGETEKNLSRIFEAAERANAILFFDEADALFGKRSEVRDAHDRYANIEISYLLQRMEEYDGVAILATNLRQNLDESFIRRIAFLVHFPFPDEASRLAIWRTIWPKETPLAPDIDPAELARQFKLAGGNIKNV
ncbi:MAG TPA: ATP-binding protein, partial [Tepidiformaceae bacterium]